MLSVVPDPPAETAPEAVDAAIARADAAFRSLRMSTGARRAVLLRAIATELHTELDGLAALAMAETGLAAPRLTGEIRQTIANLEILASWIASGAHLGVQHDEAGDGYPLGPQPDMTRYLVPVGVALNFAASNFPFAFSVAGVDTASALAAGCPIVVKAHPGHPKTSAAVFAAVRRSFASVPELDPESVQLIVGSDAGIRALRDPRVKAAAFTGSVRGGRLLASIAAARPVPIPFYGELGSINPVIATPGAVRARPDELAREFVDVFADSVGQVCTKPGMFLLPNGHALEAEIAGRAAAVPQRRMLYPALGEQYRARRDEVLRTPGVRIVAPGGVRVDRDGHVWASPTVVSVSLAVAFAHVGTIAEEAFGPLSVIVEYEETGEALRAITQLVSGTLTLSVHLEDDEADELAPLIADLQHIAGRLVINEWPAAVYITPAQHHGGPAPSTTLDCPVATSVGPQSLGRFQRAVVWQNASAALLPEELRGN